MNRVHRLTRFRWRRYFARFQVTSTISPLGRRTVNVSWSPAIVTMRLLINGFPPTSYALAAYVSLLKEEAGPAPWMIATVNADLRPLRRNNRARSRGRARLGSRYVAGARFNRRRYLTSYSCEHCPQSGSRCASCRTSGLGGRRSRLRPSLLCRSVIYRKEACTSTF